jgi:hypothetical protein
MKFYDEIYFNIPERIDGDVGRRFFASLHFAQNDRDLCFEEGFCMDGSRPVPPFV